MALASEAFAVALFRVESLRIGSADFGNHRVWYSRNKSDKKLGTYRAWYMGVTNCEHSCSWARSESRLDELIKIFLKCPTAYCLGSL